MSDAQTTPIERLCECEGPGQCQRYGRTMSKRDHAICCGQSGLEPYKEAMYRENWKRKLQPAQPTCCTHLGQEVRREGCATCKGMVEIKVYACAVHGEAQLRRKIKGVTSCVGCPDYKAKGTEP